MAYRLNMQSVNNAFYVPSSVTDSINDYTAAELRVLLVALSFGNTPANETTISEKLNMNENDAKDYLEFWVRKGVLISDSIASFSEKSREKPIESALPVKVKPVHLKPTMEEINSIIKKNEYIECALEEAEKILGITFTTSDTSTIVWILTWLGMPIEVFITIVQWCADKGKRNFRYIEKVAIDWADRGIETLEQAEEEIKYMEIRNKWEGQLLSVLDIRGRELVGKEKELSDLWNKMELSFDLIRLAYEKCIEQTGKLNFPYMNKILVSWKKKGIDTLEKAKQETNPNSKTKSKPSYDIEEISRSFVDGDDLA